MVRRVRKRSDVCIKCGETRGAAHDGRLICWDGYDELGRHNFAAAGTPLLTGADPVTVTPDGDEWDVRVNGHLWSYRDTKEEATTVADEIRAALTAGTAHLTETGA